MDNEISFIDGEAYGGNSNEVLDFRSILLSHFKRITSLACVEFRGGYWAQKSKLTTGGVTQTEKMYISDTREEYSNAVDTLFDILLPHLDKDTMTITKELNDSIENNKLTYLTKIKQKQEEILSADQYTDETDKLSIEEYKFKNLKLHRHLFQELSTFLKRKEYFKTMGIIN